MNNFNLESIFVLALLLHTLPLTALNEHFLDGAVSARYDEISLYLLPIKIIWKIFQKGLLTSPLWVEEGCSIDDTLLLLSAHLYNLDLKALIGAQLVHLLYSVISKLAISWKVYFLADRAYYWTWYDFEFVVSLSQSAKNHPHTPKWHQAIQPHWAGAKLNVRFSICCRYRGRGRWSKLYSIHLQICLGQVKC